MDPLTLLLAGKFTWGVAANLLLAHGPQAIAFGFKIAENIRAGRENTDVTAADIAEMNRLGNQTGADIYAREGVALPPP